MANKSLKEMQIDLIGEDKSTGVIIDGEICFPGDTVTVPVSVGKNLIYRERAVKHDPKAKKKTAAPAKGDEAKE